MRIRTVVLFVMGIKLLDALVTWLDCGLLDLPEANPVLASLSLSPTGYFIAVPYMLAYGALTMIVYYLALGASNRFSKYVGRSCVSTIMLISISGPLSHFNYWYPSIDFLVDFIVYLLSFCFVLAIWNVKKF